MFVALLAIVVASGSDIVKYTNDLKSKSEKVRINALYELGIMESKATPVLKPVCDCLIDSSPKVATTALRAVERINPKLHRPLSQLLLAPPDDYKSTEDAIRVLVSLQEAARPASAVILARLQAQIQASVAGRLTGLDVLPSRFFDLVKSMRLNDDESLKVIARLAGSGNRDSRTRIVAIDYYHEHVGDNAERLKVLLGILGEGIKGGVYHCVPIAGSLGKDAVDLLPALNKLKLSAKEIESEKAIEKAIKKIESP